MENDNLNIAASAAPQQVGGITPQPYGQQSASLTAQLEHDAQVYAAQVAAWAQQQGYDTRTQQAYVQQAYNTYYQQYYAQQAAMQQTAMPQSAPFAGQQAFASQPYAAAVSTTLAPVPVTGDAFNEGDGNNSGKNDGNDGTTKQRKKRRRHIIVIIIVVLLLAAAAATYLFLQPKGSDRAGRLGQLDGKSTEEIQAELNRIVDEGMFSISVASYVEFENGESEGELKIENVPGNRYLMQVEIKSDDNGETVYRSGILDPNFHIQADRLSVDLDPGTYPCTAAFRALDPETEEEVGTAAAQMTIAVLG